MSLLVRAGLASRQAAHTVVSQLDLAFFDGIGMRDWLASDEVAALSVAADWPTEPTAPLWRRFRADILRGKDQAWRDGTEVVEITEIYDGAGADRTLARVEPDASGGTPWLETPDFRAIGRLGSLVGDSHKAVIYAELDLGAGEARIRRIGPGR